MAGNGVNSGEIARDVHATAFVVIPAFNEGTVIADVARAVSQRYANVVVVDDGSADETFASARTGARFVLRHMLNRGQGAALQTGISFALRQGAEYVVTFDADGQHRVEDIDAMLRPIVEGECEITLGSRFLGEAVGIPASRRMMLKLAVVFTRVFNRLHVTDAHNGLRAFSRRAAERINITNDGMAHASQILDEIRKTRLAYREVPVSVHYTEYSLAKGQSTGHAVRVAFQYLIGKVLR
jgi:glycosyltransferase involved in cell wall biosynthesis